MGDKITLENIWSSVFSVRCAVCNATGPSFPIARKAGGKKWASDAAVDGWNGKVDVQQESKR